MLTNEALLEWLQSLAVQAEHYYCGILDNKQEKSFGIYQLSRRLNETALGGSAGTKTRTHGVSLLVHWNHSTRQTQAQATALYTAIASAQNAVIGGYPVSYLQMQHSEPIDVGLDENGVNEYVIEFVIYYGTDRKE